MEKTKTSAPPNKRSGTKGTPPASPSSNLERPSEEPKKKLTFLVLESFRKEYKRYALNHDITMVEVMEKSFELLKKHHP